MNQSENRFYREASTEESLTVEGCLAELREMFPNYARRISITETALTVNKVTIVIGGQSATYTRGDLQKNLLDCMTMARRWQQHLITEQAKDFANEHN